MGFGGGGSAPQPSPAEQRLTSLQSSYISMQMEEMRRQSALQTEQRQRIRREESTTAAGEAEMRSQYRRQGPMSSLVTAQGYGGYRGRDLRGGVRRDYTAPAWARPGAGPGAGPGRGGAPTADQLREYRSLVMELGRGSRQSYLEDEGPGGQLTRPAGRGEFWDEARRQKTLLYGGRGGSFQDRIDALRRAR